MSPHEAASTALVQSLELYAEYVGDPTPVIYQRFFAKHPDAEALFGDDQEDYIKCRMMERVLLMIMELAEGALEPQHCAYWVTDHMAWGVDQVMVCDMFEIIIATVRDGIGESWTAAMDVAWRDLMAQMTPVFQSHMPKVASPS